MSPLAKVLPTGAGGRSGTALGGRPPVDPTGAAGDGEAAPAPLATPDSGLFMSAPHYPRAMSLSHTGPSGRQRESSLPR
jgi:hypothetical protein